MAMRIAVGGIHTECSTYSPLLQTEEDFRITQGTDLLQQIALTAEAFSKVTFCPLFHARSIPGGAVQTAVYQAFKDRFLRELDQCTSVDGVLLIMHGAMHVPGLEDPEGDWISAVRKKVGPDVPIAVSYDLHGNVTQTIIDQIDIFSAYRTAPHIDVRETHLRAARMLVTQLSGGPRHFVGWVPIPVLLPGERTSTEDEPTKSLYANLLKHDQRVGVSDANLMVGYVWADVRRATAAAVVTGTQADAVSEAAETIANSYWSERSNFDFGVPAKSLQACLDDAANCSDFPFVLADSGDNPTGGGVGDRNDVLSTWLECELIDAVFAGIAEPQAVERIWTLDTGDQVRLPIGGTLGSHCPFLEIEATLRKKIGTKSSSDREVLLSVNGNLVIVTEQRRPFHNLSDFHRFGIQPETCKFLVVKSGYLSPDLAGVARTSVMALTAGAVNQDLSALSNTARHNPVFPFQKDFDWQPRVRLSGRAQG